MERAKRLVEIPLIHSWYEEQRIAGKQFHEEQQDADVRYNNFLYFYYLVNYFT